MLLPSRSSISIIIILGMHLVVFIVVVVGSLFVGRLL